MKPIRPVLWLVPLTAAALWLFRRPAHNAASAQAAPTAAAISDSTRIARSGLHNGDEYLLIFIGATFCHAADIAGFADTVEVMKQAVRAATASRHANLSVIGAALDWSPSEGSKWLGRFGTFDQEVLGGNWLNPVAVTYIFRDLPGEPALPQIVLVRRHVDISKQGIEVSPEVVVARKLGADEITAWVRAGTPIPR